MNQNKFDFYYYYIPFSIVITYFAEETYTELEQDGLIITDNKNIYKEKEKIICIRELNSKETKKQGNIMISSIETRGRRKSNLDLYLFNNDNNNNCLIGATIITILAIITVHSNALKVSITVPELVKLNDAFWLNCSHQQHSAQHNYHPTETPFGISKKNDADIYAIKWYKDDEEFYRYLPNMQPKVSIYETNGIQLDVSISYYKQPI